MGTKGINAGRLEPVNNLHAAGMVLAVRQQGPWRPVPTRGAARPQALTSERRFDAHGGRAQLGVKAGVYSGGGCVT